MKLEPNMYVRLNCNYELGIGKIIREIDEDNFIKAKFKDYFECSVPMYMISKASHNIIDLIEVGDYVNGSKVIKIENVENYPDLSNVKIEKSDFRYGVYETVFENEIKSIVTKEQMEQIAYKVG